MRTAISRWFLFGLLVGWSLTHASVFGQSSGAGSAAIFHRAGGRGPKSAQPASVDKLRQGLDKAITVDFTGQSLEEVLNHVRDRSGVPISIDDQSLGIAGMNFMRPDGQPMQFQIKATNEKTSQVLAQVSQYLPALLCHLREYGSRHHRRNGCHASDAAARQRQSRGSPRKQGDPRLGEESRHQSRHRSESRHASRRPDRACKWITPASRRPCVCWRNWRASRRCAWGT